MARQRRTSAVLETTRQRLAGLKQIDTAPDFGGNLNVAGGEALVTDLGGELDSYNHNSVALDEQQNVVETKESGAAFQRRDQSRRTISSHQATRRERPRNLGTPARPSGRAQLARVWAGSLTPSLAAQYRMP